MLELKPVIKKFYEIKEEKLPEDQAQKSFIRWLLADDNYNFFMRLFRIEAGGHINSHFHPWEHEIFILEGKGRIKIGTKIYNVEEGNFIYIPPNADHEYWAESELKFLCIIPSKPTAEELDKPLPY
ncbi:cupin domain-containing protein [Caldisphaera sp.]|uniref:cupin domain-containing protein n=1 Tax=Caldisphaera sp. TaxID=2060322 RepID=UPI003D0CD3F5